MVTKEYVRSKYGRIIDELVAEWQAKLDYTIEDGECVSILIHWTTPHQLDAMVGITLDESGLEIISFLNRQHIHSGRNRSWDTPPAKLRASLREIKADLDSASRPPLS